MLQSSTLDNIPEEQFAELTVQETLNAADTFAELDVFSLDDVMIHHEEVDDVRVYLLDVVCTSAFGFILYIYYIVGISVIVHL